MNEVNKLFQELDKKVNNLNEKFITEVEKTKQTNIPTPQKTLEYEKFSKSKKKLNGKHHQ
jgi:hypothetical protein